MAHSKTPAVTVIESAGAGHLPAAPAHAFAELLQVLACGEDSAAVTFEHLAQSCGNGPLYVAVKGMAADELKHQQWLTRLRRALPPVAPDTRFQRLLRRFFGRLANPDPRVHFTRIFALDAAVCQLLSVIQRRPLAAVPDQSQNLIIRLIQKDEARHVGIARLAAGPLLQSARGRDLVAEVRGGLIEVLAERAAAFEALQVDPDRLWLRLRRNPQQGAASRCA